MERQRNNGSMAPVFRDYAGARQRDRVGPGLRKRGGSLASIHTKKKKKKKESDYSSFTYRVARNNNYRYTQTEYARCVHLLRGHRSYCVSLTCTCERLHIRVRSE